MLSRPTWSPASSPRLRRWLRAPVAKYWQIWLSLVVSVAVGVGAAYVHGLAAGLEAAGFVLLVMLFQLLDRRARFGHVRPSSRPVPGIPDDGWLTERGARRPVGGSPSDVALEFPWRRRHRGRGSGLSRRDEREARRRADKVARLTLGDDVWARLQRDGFLEVASGCYPGITYRLRPGSRIEVRGAPNVQRPWRYAYLCVVPAYPLPAVEFLVHLYLYLRDDEMAVLRVAAPQPLDGLDPWTF